MSLTQAILVGIGIMLFFIYDEIGKVRRFFEERDPILKDAADDLKFNLPEIRRDMSDVRDVVRKLDQFGR